MKIGKESFGKGHNLADELLSVVTLQTGVMIDHEMKLDKLRDSVRSLTPVLQKISEAMEAQDRANDSQTRANDSFIELIESVRAEIAELPPLRARIFAFEQEIARLMDHAREYDSAMALDVNTLRTEVQALRSELARSLRGDVNATERDANRALGWSDMAAPHVD